MNQDPVKCPHVLFTFLDLISDFDYVSPQYENTIHKIGEKVEELIKERKIGGQFDLFSRIMEVE